MQIEEMRLNESIRYWVTPGCSPTKDRDIAIRESLRYIPEEIARALAEAIATYSLQDQTRSYNYLDLNLPIHRVHEKIGNRINSVQIGFFAKAKEVTPFITFIPTARMENSLTQENEGQILKLTKKLYHHELANIPWEEKIKLIIDNINEVLESARKFKLT